MITDNVLTRFKAYLHDISGHNVHKGNEDIGANDYPAWTITLEEDWKVTFLNTKGMDALINIKCNLFVDRQNSDQALQIMLKTLKKINLFDVNSGSGIGSDQVDLNNEATISTEIQENLIKLSFPYRLKTIIQEED